MWIRHSFECTIAYIETLSERIRRRTLRFYVFGRPGTSIVKLLAMRLALPILIDSKALFRIRGRRSFVCHFGVIFERVFNLKKVDLAQISLGSPLHCAVSCVGVGRLVI